MLKNKKPFYFFPLVLCLFLNFNTYLKKVSIIINSKNKKDLYINILYIFIIYNNLLIRCLYFWYPKYVWKYFFLLAF